MKSTSASGLLVAFGFLALAAPSQGAVVFSDTFSGSGPLAGHAPNIVQKAGDTWTDPNNGFSLSPTGTVTSVWSGAPIMANAPFHVAAGSIYTISANIEAQGGWVGVGFQSTASAGPTWSLNMAPWFFLSDNYGNAKAFPFGAEDSDALANEWGVAQGAKLSIVLDTTGAQWAATAFMGGTQRGATYTYLVNPTIEYVSLIRTGATGIISNLEISASVVPEPAGLAGLILIGGSVLARRRRAVR